MSFYMREFASEEKFDISKFLNFENDVYDVLDSPFLALLSQLPVVEYYNVDNGNENFALIVMDGMSYDEWFILKNYLNDFEIKELESCDVNLLDERERYWIDYYNTYSGEGYNSTYGGSGKNLYDYDLIVEVYQKLKNIKETARTIGCSVDCVGQVLKDRDVEILSSDIVSKNEYGKKRISGSRIL